MDDLEEVVTRVEALRDRRVLVTGAGGFIGTALCHALLANGARVFGIARRPAPRRIDSVEWHEVDIADLGALRSAYSRIRPELVFHLAGHVTGEQGMAQVIPALKGNLITAVNVMVSCAEVGCQRLIIAASLEEPDVGDAVPRLASPYAAAKWAARAYGMMFHSLYGLPIVHGRVFITFGPGQAGSPKLIPYTIESLLAGSIPRYTSGTRPVDWIYIDDVARGLIALALAPGVEGRTLDIGSGSLVSVREVVGLIFEIIECRDEPLFGSVPSRRDEIVRVADTALTRSIVAWSPEVSLREGLRRTVEWHRSRLTSSAQATSTPAVRA
jgi:UDP-glucose 4-epimerase